MPNKQEGIQTHILISQAAKFHLMATKGNNQYPSNKSFESAPRVCNYNESQRNNPQLNNN